MPSILALNHVCKTRFGCLMSATACVLMLQACDIVSERDCGVFSHPELSLWQPASLPASVRFMAEDGATEDYVRSAIVRNEPFLGSDGASNDEDVICLLDATQHLYNLNTDLAIVTRFVQEERLLTPDEEEVLLLEHKVEKPDGVTLSGAFIADISVFETRIEADPERVSYLDTDVIGGVSYEDVVTIRIPAPDSAPDTTQATDPEVPANVAADFIREIRFARTYGIVAYTDASEREFVRVNSTP